MTTDFTAGKCFIPPEGENESVRLSVVVPIFNGLDYLGECLDSVLRQLPGDCECVVVDDGSNAATVAALKDYAAAHAAANLRILYGPHGGASHARNLGLEAARGEFVCFLDGDDRLHDGFLAKSCEWFGQDVDLVIFPFDRVENGETTRIPLQLRIYESPSQFADHYLVDRHLRVYSQCNKFYRKSVIDRSALRFDESVEFGEDRLFNFAFIEQCGRIATSPDCMFDYICRGGDSMSTKHLPNFAARLMALHEAKMKTFLGLAQTASEDERRSFVHYDRSRIVEEAVGRFAAHPEEIAESLPVLNCILFGDFIDDGLPADVLIVLGSPTCQYRVEKALEVGRRNPKTVYVVTGGNLHLKGPESEAEFMRDYLLDHGISPERVVLENLARNTAENLRFSMDRLDQMLETGVLPSASPRIGVISGTYHLTRVLEIAGVVLGARAKGLRAIPAYGPHSRPDNWFMHPPFVRFVLNEIRKRKGP